MGTQTSLDAEQKPVDIRERRPLYGDDRSRMGFVETVIEFEEGRPLALIRYRAMKEIGADADRQALNTLVQLANGYGPDPIPALLAWYDPEIWRFSVQPLNEVAFEYFGRRLIVLTERQFFWKLRGLRKAESGYQDHDTAAKCLNIPWLADPDPGDETTTPEAK